MSSGFVGAVRARADRPAHRPGSTRASTKQRGGLTGSVASRIAENFVRMQIASALFNDPARFKTESLLTHSIGPEALGHYKAEWLAEPMSVNTSTSAGSPRR